MAVDFSSDALIESTKTRCLVPDSQLLFTDRQIAKILTEELHSDMVPLIMAVHEEYFVANHDQDIDASTNYYLTSPRAIGGKARDVVLLDPNNNEIEIPRRMPEAKKNNPIPTQQFVWGYYWSGDGVQLLPGDQNLSNYSLRMRIFRRPNNIVITSDAGQITAINTGTNVVTLDNAPSSWTTSTTFDVVQSAPPYHTRGEDQGISALAGFDLTFDSLPSTMQVGDWVAESGYAPLAQIPFEAQKLLAQRGAMKLLESMNDDRGFKNASVVYEDMVTKFRQLLTPRTDGTPLKLNSWRGIMDYGQGTRWWR